MSASTRILLGRHLALLCLNFMIVVALAACGARGSGGPTAPINTPSQQPTPLSLDDAQRVAGDFLNAWVSSDYDTMYGMLSTESRDAYPLQTFEDRYSAVESQITLLAGGKSYRLTNVLRRSTAVDLAYDMTFKTRTFGDFTDAGRTLHLVTTPDGWRVAWSPDDIFQGMKDGAYLDVTKTYPTRANIYDHDGNVIADENGVVIHVALLTKTYPDGNPDHCFAELSRVFKPLTDTQKSIFTDHTGRDFKYDIGDINLDKFKTEKAALERVCTLDYTNIQTRRYLEGGLAPHIVGHVGPIPAENLDAWVARGYSPDAMVGLDGIEAYWEDTLAGRGAAKLTLRTRNGDSRVLAERAAIPSQSVYLTIDRKLQQAIQEMLADAFATSVWGKWATGAAAIVMDVHTGEIRAIASYPTFNVDAFNPNTSLPNAQQLLEEWAKDPMKPTFNRATLGQYPAGSVFKIVSMAAAADSGLFTLKTPIYCSGVWNGQPLGDRLRKDWLVGGHGTINLEQALTGSCDVYFWNVGWTLNAKDPYILINYARRFGFGAPTKIKDVAESAGNIPDPLTYEQQTGLKWRGSDALNFVIGQGAVTVTPLQVVRAVAAIANGGTLYQPLLVSKVGIIGEPSYIAQPIPNGKLGVKDDVLAGIRKAMCAVTTDPVLGTAQFVFKGMEPGVVVCGKTGTAQAGLSNDQPHAWFTAFAGKTADTPDIAIVVIVEHSNEGSYVAAPIVRRIVETYYGLTISPWPDWWGGGLPTVTSGD